MFQPGSVNRVTRKQHLDDSFTIANRVMKANGEVYRLDTAMTWLHHVTKGAATSEARCCACYLR